MTENKAQILPHLQESLQKLTELAEAASQEELGYDDDPVDIDAVLQAAVAMADKMAVSRAKGRGGWYDPSRCERSFLLAGLLGHIGKGDMVDVMNFAMMYWMRADEAIREAGVEGYQKEIGEGLQTWAKGFLQDAYEQMDRLYRETLEQEQLKLIDAQTGALQLSQPLTLDDVLHAQTVINSYLETVIRALMAAMPATVGLQVKVTATDPGPGMFPTVGVSVMLNGRQEA